MWFLAGSVVLTLLTALAFALIRGEFDPASFSPSDAGGLPLGPIITNAAAMLVGITFGSVHESLKAVRGEVGILEVSKRALNSAAFFKSVLASPIVFGGVYLAAQKQPDQVIALIFAFQNGFFCNAILQRKSAGR